MIEENTSETIGSFPLLPLSPQNHLDNLLCLHDLCLFLAPLLPLDALFLECFFAHDDAVWETDQIGIRKFATGGELAIVEECLDPCFPKFQVERFCRFPYILLFPKGEKVYRERRNAFRPQDSPRIVM